MKNRTRKWIRSAIEIFIHGGASAVSAALMASAVDPHDFPFLSVKSWQLMGGCFLSNGTVRFIQWWTANPIPPEEDTAAPFPVATPVISLNPLSKVQPITVQPEPPIGP